MKIPAFLYSLFWEYDPEAIDTGKHANLIIARVMERGSWAAMVWLRETYSKEQLTDFVETRGNRVLPLRELNYWALICDLSPGKRRELLKSAGARQREWLRRHAS